MNTALLPSPVTRRPRTAAGEIAWRVVVVLIVAAGVAARWAWLGRASLWFDEGYTAWAASLPVGQIFRVIRVDTAPPLHYLVLHVWTGVFGRSEAGLRSLSAACASVALGVGVMTAIRLFRRPLAIVAAAGLLAIAYVPIAFAHEARFYAPMLMLTAFSLHLAIRLAQRFSTAAATAMTLCWTASLYTNNAMLLYVVMTAAAWLCAAGAVSVRRRMLHLAIVGGATALLYLPWLPTLLAQSRAVKGNFWQATPGYWELPDMLARLSGVRGDRFTAPHGFEVAAAAVLAAAVGIGAVRAGRTTAALFVVGVLPVGVTFASSRLFTPVFLERSLIGSCAALPLLLAGPLEWLPVAVARYVWAGVLVGWLNLMGRSAQGQLLGEHPENWRGICAFVQREMAAEPGRKLVLFTANEGELLFDYYARGGDYRPVDWVSGAPESFFALLPPRTMRRVRSDADLTKLDTLLRGSNPQQIWYVQNHYYWSDPEHRVLGLLNDGDELADEEPFGEITVFHFVPRGSLP